MTRNPSPPGPPAPAYPRAAAVQQTPASGVVQQTRAFGVIQPIRAFGAIVTSHTQRARGAHMDELVTGGGGLFQMRDPDRHVMSRPSGVYNFVRVAGATRNQAATFISARAPHATLAQGRPVLYAGTAAFDAGRLDWWSNYSGTYQPIAEFNRQAALPTDRFIPWQKLQMGGVGLQRGMLSDHRAAQAPQGRRDEKAEKARKTPVPTAFSGAKDAGPTSAARPATRPGGKNP